MTTRRGFLGAIGALGGGAFLAGARSPESPIPTEAEHVAVTTPPPAPEGQISTARNYPIVFRLKGAGKVTRGGIDYIAVVLDGEPCWLPLHRAPQ